MSDEFADSFLMIGRNAGFEQDHVSRIARSSGDRLLKILCLGNDADVIFEREYLADAHAVNGLRVREDDTDGRWLFGLVRLGGSLAHAANGAQELLLPLKAVFVNDGGDGAASVLFRAADDAAYATDHDVMRSAENVSRHCDAEIDG